MDHSIISIREFVYKAVREIGGGQPVAHGEALICREGYIVGHHGYRSRMKSSSVLDGGSGVSNLVYTREHLASRWVRGTSRPRGRGSAAFS
jgi:hypothetical protein